MVLKVVHINKKAVVKDAEAKAMWENVLKPKWDQQARERGARLLAELRGEKTPISKPSPPKMRS